MIFHSIFIFDNQELSNCFIFREILFKNTNENKSSYFIFYILETNEEYPSFGESSFSNEDSHKFI